jgi:hypothetical protein
MSWLLIFANRSEIELPSFLMVERMFVAGN